MLFSSHPKFTTYAFSGLVFIWPGCHNKTSQSRWPKQQKCTSSQFRKLEVQEHLCNRLGFSWASFIDLLMVNFLMNSNTLSFYTHMNYLSKGCDTKYSHVWGYGWSQPTHKHFENYNPIDNKIQNFLNTSKLLNFFFYKTFPYSQIGIFT